MSFGAIKKNQFAFSVVISCRYFFKVKMLFSNNHGMKLEMSINLKHITFTSYVCQYFFSSKLKK